MSITPLVLTTLYRYVKSSSLIVDNCEGTGLVLESLVGGLEISKSKRVQIQITDKSPMINLDHVDQATIYLSKTGLDVEIITSSTTGVNVLPYLSYNPVHVSVSILFFCPIHLITPTFIPFVLLVVQEGR